MRYELTHNEWAAVKPLLPTKPRGVPAADHRRVLNGIFGSCDLPGGAIYRAASARAEMAQCAALIAPS